MTTILDSLQLQKQMKQFWGQKDMALWNDTFLRPKTTQQCPQSERWETTMERQSTYGHKCTNEVPHVSETKKPKRSTPVWRIQICYPFSYGGNALEKSVNINYSQLSCPKKTIIRNNLHFLNWKCELGPTGYYLPIITQCYSLFTIT